MKIADGNGKKNCRKMILRVVDRKSTYSAEIQPLAFSS